MLLCSDGTLYTGWTNDLAHRLKMHNSGRASRYTRARLPVRLAYCEKHPTKRTAMQREAAIKKMTRRAKLALIAAKNTNHLDLENELSNGGICIMTKMITEVLNIKYPIIQGGMAWISDAKMAAAASNAGGAGIISCGGRTTEYVRDAIREAKKLTDKPFGANVMLMAPNKDEIVDVICEEKPAFVTLGAGNPVPYFEKFHAAGIKVIPVVPNVKLAKRVASKGADAMVIEGMEAGGHIGVLTTMALMTEVLPEVTDVPVLVAGGIADGRGIAAALLMGAAGVQIGTRFLVAEECPVHPNMKQKLIEAIDTDTIVTGLTLGGAVRGLKNKFSLEFVKKENEGKTPKEELIKETTGTNKLAAVDGDVENGMMQAGQSLLPLKKIEPMKKIMDDLMAQARETLKNAAKIKI